MSDGQEGKRERVRRLLLDPLAGNGFRKSARISADRHKEMLTRLADNLAYMSDASLSTLRDMMLTKGEGRQRDIWPAQATFYGFADLIEPRPVEELPALLRWFRSVEGPKAKDEGTLVETWAYFQKYKRPPKMGLFIIREQADENQRKLALCEERIGNGVATDDEKNWARWYRDRLAYCERIVSDGQKGRAA